MLRFADGVSNQLYQELLRQDLDGPTQGGTL
jgi:hypothetical protein